MDDLAYTTTSGATPVTVPAAAAGGSVLDTTPVLSGTISRAFSTYTTTDGVIYDIADAGFRVQDAVSGDVYTMKNAETLDVSELANKAQLTRIDMAGDSAANTVKLSLNDVLSTAATDGVHKLAITGDANDSVDINTAEWTHSGNTVSEGTHTYAVYNANGADNAQLLIDQTLFNAAHVN